MSSGERAKPPATYEERNPFDISRRSQTDVAAEIAKRMAAWKQARGRSSAVPTTPSADASPGDANRSPVSAPVQPAPVPRFAERGAPAPQAAPQKQADGPTPPRNPAAGAQARRETRAPFFATFSIQRAMPPAPSPKQSAAPAPAPKEAGRAAIAEAEQAPLLSEAAAGENGSIAARETDAGRDDRPSATAPDLAPTHASTGPASEMPSSDAHSAESRIGDNLPGDAAAAPPPDSESVPAPELEAREAIAEGAAHAAEPVVPGGEQAAAAEDAIEKRRSKARDVMARWMAAHDLDGSKDEKSPLIENRETKAAEPAAREIEQQDTPASDPDAPRITPAIAPIEALDVISGRKEPTFDRPTRRESPIEIAAAATPATTVQDERSVPKTRDIAPAVPSGHALDGMSVRTEPTFGGSPGKKRPSTTSAPAALDTEAARSKRRIELPAIQTRIEARRIDALRADPEIGADRAAFHQVGPEAPALPPVITVPARGERRGTGWAIALGAVLLVLGITAPAAILQHWRQERLVPQDQAGMKPLPAPVQDQASQPATTQAPVTAQSTPPAPPQPQPVPPAAPDVQPPANETANALPPSTKAETEEAGPQKQAALGPLREGGQLNEAPVSAPPPPWKSAGAPLASQEQTDPSSVSDQPSPMVARPFIPDGTAATPVLRAPTTGTATVPIDGGSASRAQSASISLKPTLIPQLKPKAPALRAGGGVQQEAARKPKPFVPEFEQMLQNLVNTLSEGQQPNPATKPLPPSTRR